MTEQEDALYTIDEVARRLHVDDTTVRRWIQHGTLAAITLPMYHGGTKHRYRIKASTMETLLSTPTIPRNGAH